MDNTQIAKRGSNGDALSALDAEWNRMNAALERLGQVEALQVVEPVRRCGRLLVALDLTASRGWSLRQARKATAAMFEAIAAVGSVAVRLAYFRGHDARRGHGRMMRLPCAGPCWGSPAGWVIRRSRGCCS